MRITYTCHDNCLHVKLYWMQLLNLAWFNFIQISFTVYVSTMTIVGLQLAHYHHHHYYYYYFYYYYYK